MTRTAGSVGGALRARNDFGAALHARFRKAERSEHALAREALSADVRYHPADGAGPIRLGVLVEAREPAGRFVVVAGRMRWQLSEEEWARIDEACRDEIGEERSPTRMGLRWFLADDEVMDGRPDRWSLVRAAASEPTFALRVEVPNPLPAAVRRRLAAARSLGDFASHAEEACLAEYLRGGESRESRGFFAVFPDLSR